MTINKQHVHLRGLIFIIVLGCASLSAHAQFKTASVLADEGFHKISVPHAGLYKIDADFVRSFAGETDPNRFAIYGNQGGVVPEASAIDRIDDLEQLPLQFIGNEDNVWSSDEYFVFYAEGDEWWTNTQNNARQLMNPYTEVKYYFIHTDRVDAKRVRPMAVVTDYQEITSAYDDLQHYEDDVNNLLGGNFGTQGSGKRWYGANFGIERNLDLTGRFDLSNVIEGSEMNLSATLAVRSDRKSTARLEFGNESSQVSNSSINLLNSLTTYADRNTLRVAATYNSSTPYAVRITTSPGSNNFDAWLDYATLHTTKALRYENQPLFYRAYRPDDELIRYDINGDGDLSIWAISSAHEVESVPTNRNGSVLQAVGQANQEYVIFNPNQDVSQEPSYVESVSPQNLHGMETPEYVVLYHENFIDAATRLAEHRRSHDGLRVALVDVSQVFNEFGGGSPDPSAIRDFARMLYNREEGFGYLCLFGDASYDYRGLSPDLNDDNFIPCYQTNSELSPISGFPSDDYFALLNDNEGGDLEGGVDIAVGRIPVSTTFEANFAVDKLINYDTDDVFYGAWKNDMIFVADDEDNNTHLVQNERLTDLVYNFYPQTDIKKVYFDAFDQQSTTGDDRYPDAKEALNTAIENGALMLNYFGHGGPNGWAQERVLEIQDILSWTNQKRLPLFITATCTFSAYDDAGEESGGELTFLNPTGGSIGLVSTVRAVTIYANERLVRSFLSFVYERDEEGEPLRLGEVMRRAKNNHRSDTLSINARKFALIGDPALKLAFPKYNTVITEINDTEADLFGDTLGALQEVRLKGEIQDFNDDVVGDFTGLVDITLYDKPQVVTTLANDSDSRKRDFEQYSTVLFTGSTSVENGVFSLSFRIPKDINYEIGPGRINMYARSTVANVDANGYRDQLYIGGTDNSGISDDSPPGLSVFMNNRSFESGDRVSPNPTMLIDLQDDFGINLSNASIGHQITAILDGDVRNPIILNEFYSATPGRSAEGTINYPLLGLSTGEHTLLVQAYDIANNHAEARITFIVDENRVRQLSDTRILPNPASTGDHVSLSFNHELPFGLYNLEFEAYDLYGRRVMRIQDQVTTSTNGSIDYPLQITNQSNNSLSAGMYVYKVVLESASELQQSGGATFEGGRFLIVD